VDLNGYSSRFFYSLLQAHVNCSFFRIIWKKTKLEDWDCSRHRNFWLRQNPATRVTQISTSLDKSPATVILYFIFFSEFRCKKLILLTVKVNKTYTTVYLTRLRAVQFRYNLKKNISLTKIRSRPLYLFISLCTGNINLILINYKYFWE